MRAADLKEYLQAAFEVCRPTLRATLTVGDNRVEANWTSTKGLDVTVVDTQEPQSRRRIKRRGTK